MKLTRKDVIDIRRDLARGDSQVRIAKLRGIPIGTVSNIALGRTWKDVADNEGSERTCYLSEDWLLTRLRQRRHTVEELSKMCGDCEFKVERMLASMQEAGHLVFKFGDAWGLEKTPAATSETLDYVSDSDGTYTFGFCGDTHLGSKYERLDVLGDLYEHFRKAGVDRVFHAGNWIDGEARFNAHDLLVHGMDQQIAHLVEKYPTINGVTTYAIAGDDHEGWYGQREGVDIGKHAERIMRESKRCDWVNLGFMEAFVNLQNAKTGESSRLLVMHPGGGSAYAHSYKPQKIVEGFAGGEKPAVLLIGHYHKLSQNMIRNVWAIQTGCTQDQTPFMRKKGIDAHVGGGICRLRQDANGAIVGCQVEFFNYFNRGYYNNRWSHGGSVTLPNRGAKERAT